MSEVSKTSENDAKQAMEAARLKVVDSEKEIQKIKLLIKNMQQSTDTSSNQLKLSVSDLKGLTEAESKINFFFQLSAPVEEKNLDKFYDAKNDNDTTINFESVDIDIATLSVRLFDDVVQLGTSEALDVSQWCSFDAMEYGDNKNESKAKEIEVEIIPEYKASSPSSGGSSDDVVVVENKEQTDDDNSTDDVDAKTKKEEITEVSTPTKNDANIPLCSITLRVEYRPSQTDVLDELYTLLNQASKTKSSAIEELRKRAMDISRSTDNTASTPADLSTPEEVSLTSSAAVKSGFLNKSKKKNSDGFFTKWYQKTIGPKSTFRLMMPIFQNHCLFFGVVALMHFKGNFLEIPAPV